MSLELELACREWVKLSGWSPESKMMGLVACVLTRKPMLCVDIGTYAGRTLLPVAWALKQNGSGVVYGIDPYSNDACTEGWPEGQDHSGWDKNPLKPYFDEAMSAVIKFGLLNHADIFRLRSADAVSRFDDGSIDLLHIDGNHSESSAMADVTLYLPKMKPGGDLWMDDVGWESTQKAVAFLNEHCDLVKSYEDVVAGQPWFNHYRVR